MRPERGFQHIVHLTHPSPVGSRDLVTRYKHLSAAPTVAEMTSRHHGHTVAGVQNADRIRRTNHFPYFARLRLRKGMNSSQAITHSLMILGVSGAHFSFSSVKASREAFELEVV